MPNVFDYLEWRGDLTFSEVPVGEVDNLIFCLLSYVDLDHVVPENGRITIHRAAAEYFFNHGDDSERPLGWIVPADILTLFRRMANYPRYRDLELTGYVNAICEKREMQFSALTIRLPGEGLFVAFRGTDDTLVGWREDFNLAYMDEVPSQRMAADYLNALDLTPDTTLYVGGHSKGGNLAVWGAVHAEEAVRHRIAQVYSNDGPGFSEGMIASEAYRAMAERIRIILPEDSLVGLLLEHDERYTVVKSGGKGVYQHNGLYWEVLGSSFIRADRLSHRGIQHDTVVRERILAMTREEREHLVRIMFSLLESTGAKTLTELHESGPKAVITMIKAFRELSEEDQETTAFLWDKLFRGKLGESVGTAKPPKAIGKRSRRKGKIRVSFFPLFLP